MVLGCTSFGNAGGGAILLTLAEPVRPSWVLAVEVLCLGRRTEAESTGEATGDTPLATTGVASEDDSSALH